MPEAGGEGAVMNDCPMCQCGHPASDHFLDSFLVVIQGVEEESDRPTHCERCGCQWFEEAKGEVDHG